MSLRKDCSLNTLVTLLAQHFVLLSDYTCLSPIRVASERAPDCSDVGERGEGTKKVWMLNEEGKKK